MTHLSDGLSIKAGISDAPTIIIAETTQTDHFSLLLRKLPNRKRPEPTLKLKLTLEKCFKKCILKIHDIHLTNKVGHLLSEPDLCALTKNIT